MMSCQSISFLCEKNLNMLKKHKENFPLLELDHYKVISITYVTEVLPWQQAKYSSSAPDKGTQDKCDAPHLGNSNSLVLLLRQNMLSLWGLLTHICGCAGKKVKDCT